MSLLTLVVGLGVTLGIIVLAGRPRTPSLWLIVGAGFGGFLAKAVLDLLFGSTTLAREFGFWLFLGPALLILSIGIWLKLRWIESRRAGSRD